MKVIVCGGRNFSDKDYFNKVMSLLHEQLTITEIIEGGAKGADRLAFQWATENDIKVSEFPADWEKFGKSAGFVRNRLMLEQETDCVIAFPGGKGTQNMIKLALEAGIMVYSNVIV